MIWLGNKIQSLGWWLHNGIYQEYRPRAIIFLGYRIESLGNILLDRYEGEEK